MTCSSSTIFSRKAIAALCAIGVLAIAPARGDAVRPAPQEAVAKARVALAKGDGIAAEVPLRMAMRNGLAKDAARAELGEALLLQGNRREAREVLYGGDFVPESAARGWQARGRLELADGHLPQAGQAFDQSYRMDPDSASLWVDIGKLRFTGGEHAEAIEASERAVKLDPKNPRALELRGLLIREQFGLQSALPWFEAGLQVAPNDVGLLGEYAATLGELGQYRAMLVVCRKLAKINPGNARVLYLQAVLAARAGQTTLARTILQKAGPALRDVPSAIMLNGILEFRAGNDNLAVEHFDRLVRLQPDNLQARMMLVRALRARNLDRQAVDTAGVWVTLESAPPYLLQLTGEAYVALGRKAEGAALFERAGDTGQRPSEYLPTGQPLGVWAIAYREAPNLAANAVPYIRGLIEAGEEKQAIAVADRLKLANPGAAEAWLLAGDARLIGNDALGALDQYGRAALIRFNLPTLERIDHAMRLLGRDADANAMVARYLRQNPHSPQALKLLSDGRAAVGNIAGAEKVEALLSAKGLRNP